MTSTAAAYDTGPAGHPIVRCSGRVVDAIAAVAGTPAWSMTPNEQRTALVDLTRAQAQLCELRLRVLASGDNNSIGSDTGASSAASWLAHATRQTRTNAAADVRLAAQLDKKFEATRTALSAGRLNEDQARVIIYAINDLPDDITAVDRARAEAFLIDKALVFDAKALRILGRRLFEVIDPDAADEQEGKKLKKEEDEARRTAWFKIRDNGDGTHCGTFKLPTLHAEMLGKVLGALTSPRRLGPAGRTDPDGSKISYPTLLGRGLMELIENLPTTRLPNCGGNNATIVVTTDLATLRTGLGAATLDTGSKISADQARRLACNAAIIPLVLGGDSMPLDVGREQRLHTKSQRVAIAHRDKQCTAENCDRPPGWCEYHHETPWSHGGTTTTKDGRLYCSWHHHLVHDDTYLKTKTPNGQTRFRRRQ